jgi:hypothetical protein
MFQSFTTSHFRLYTYKLVSIQNSGRYTVWLSSDNETYFTYPQWGLLLLKFPHSPLTSTFRTQSNSVFSTFTPIERQTPLGRRFRNIRTVFDTWSEDSRNMNWNELKFHVRRSNWSCQTQMNNSSEISNFTRRKGTSDIGCKTKNTNQQPYFIVHKN